MKAQTLPMRFVPWILATALVSSFCVTAGCRIAEPSPKSVPASRFPVPPQLPLSGVTVIIDPGHGGEDPGAVTPFATEAAYSYRMALELRQALTAQGARVIYTVRSRALDPAFCALQTGLPVPRDASLVADGLPIRERHSPRQLWLRAAPARIAWNARTGPFPERRFFFLSLHLDDSSDARVRGSMVCIDRRRAPPAFAIALAGELARDGLARRGLDDGQGGLSLRELGVLNPEYNPIPQSALLEITTLSHLDDLFQAADPAWRAQMIRRIVTAILIVCHSDNRVSSR